MKYEQGQQIKRITYMEMIFDEIQKAVAEGCAVNENSFRELVQYYESEQWKLDYGADERGELPVGLKRGVLSEDGVYNLICDIEGLQEKE